jgi:glycosyltransferase involved in cell wall biosynthesis
MSSCSILISRWSRTGGIRALIQLANGLQGRGHAVRLLVLDPGGEPPFPLDSGVLVESLASGTLPTRLARIATRVVAPWRLPRADALIFSDYPTAYLASVAHRLGRVRQPIFFVQSYDPILFGEDHLARWRSARRAVASTSYDLRLTYVSSSTFMRDLLSSGHGQLAVVANPGVDVGIFHPCGQRPAGGPPIVATVARSLSAKGFDRFAETMRIVERARPDVRVRVITSDRLDVVPSAWEVVGPADDRALAEAYADADVFVATSLFESFALTPLEAMACGVAVVSTDNRGLHDYAVDGENCLIVSRPDPERLADSIVRLLASADLRQRLAAAGLHTARQRPWRSFVDSFERVLHVS